LLNLLKFCSAAIFFLSLALLQVFSEPF
jgi:hypothetical protein